jgi:hypothetical protein
VLLLEDDIWPYPQKNCFRTFLSNIADPALAQENRARQEVERIQKNDIVLALQHPTQHDNTSELEEPSAFSVAIGICKRVLGDYWKALGHEHASTLDAVNKVGLLYAVDSGEQKLYNHASNSSTRTA